MIKKCLVMFSYTEFGLKNNQGGFASLNQKNKVHCIRQYESGSDRCHVKISDKYLEVLPGDAIENDVCFISAALAKIPSDVLASWFKYSPVSRNTLGLMIKRMCSDAEISEGFTNHSLHAYGPQLYLTHKSLRN